MRGTYVWSKRKRQFHKNAKQWIKQIQDNGKDEYLREKFRKLATEILDDHTEVLERLADEEVDIQDECGPTAD